MSTTTTFDLARFTRAAEERDAAAQLSMYSDDATVTIADKNTPPGAPRVLHGRAEINGWLQDTYGREMTHQVRHRVQDEHGAAYTPALPTGPTCCASP
jgi:ketosteroid isomerase-like protein